MDAPEKKSSGRGLKWTAVGILVSLVFLWLSTSRVSWGQLGDVVARVHWWPWIPLAMAAYLVGHVVRGWRCKLIVGDLAPISLTSATNVVVLGYGANNILPARLGELARAGMLAQRTGLSYVQCLTVTFLERILDAMVILVLFVLAASHRDLPGWMRDVSDVATVVVAGAMLVVAAAVLLPSLLPRAATHLTARLQGRGRLGGKLVSTAYDVVQALAPLRRPGRALGVLTLSVVVWGFEAGLFLAVLPAFELAASPALATLAMSMTNLGILAPSSPGFVGPFHYFCAKAIETAGVEPAVALSYAITVHAAFFVPITMWAIGVIVAQGVQLSKTISLTRSARVARLSELRAGQVIAQYRVLQPSRPSDRFVTAVVEPMLPWHLVSLAEGERATLLAAVSEFVAGSVAALPKHLRLKARLGLWGFAFIFGLSAAGRFHRLPVERRARMVERWAFGRLALPRQLFRMLRGTALLAFCDHPLVAGKLQQKAQKDGASKRLTVVGPS